MNATWKIVWIVSSMIIYIDYTTSRLYYTLQTVLLAIPNDTVASSIIIYNQIINSIFFDNWTFVVFDKHFISKSNKSKHTKVACNVEEIQNTLTITIT